MQKFRVYALIHGQTIPLGSLAGCELRHMDLDEQRARAFSPIRYDFSEDDCGYKTYAMNLPFVDSMKLRTNHVAICEIRESEPSKALGGAIKEFDKLCSRLFLAGIQDVKSKTGNLYSGETYLYQVNKIYCLDGEGGEHDVDINLKSGNIFLPNRPDRTDWCVKETGHFLDQLLEFKDPVFNKALKYLYSSSVGYFRSESYEKIALDHFKSIELIINTLSSNSSKDSFKERVDKVATILSLTNEECTEIKKYWDARSNGDIAHSSHNDPTSFYPNQFPPPKNLEYPWASFDRTARVILLKYFDIRKRYFQVDIQQPYGRVDHLTLGVVNEHSECNHLFFQTLTKHRKEVLKELKTVFVNVYGLDKKDVQVEFDNSTKRARVLVRGDKDIKLVSISRKIITV